MIEQLKTGLKQWPADARSWLRGRGLELWLITGIWFVLSAVIFWLASGHESPRRYQDEFLFWGVAKSFAGGLGLTWRGADLGLRSWLYPVLLAPAFWIGSTVPESYTAVKLINSLLITGTLFPAYLMARMYAERWPALVAALLAISVPAMNYAGVIGTESLAYPVATAAFGAMLLAIVQPRLRNWILALAMIVLAALTRTQFAIFLPIFFATLLMAGLMRESVPRREYFTKQKWLIVANLALFAVIGLAFLVFGRKVVGLYGGVFEGVSPTWSGVKFWAKAFTADVYLLAGVIPVIATLAMLLHKDNRRDPLVGALIALALVASLVFIAQVSWFSAINQYNWRTRNIFYERYMFYIAPIFFTGFVAAWRRVSVGSAIFSTVFAFIVMTGFHRDAVLVPFSYDSFGLTLAGWFMDANPDWVLNIDTLLARITLVLGAIYAISTVERRSVARFGMTISTILLFVILLGGQAKTWDYARQFSHDAFLSFPRPANFIDQNTDQEVGMIVTSTDAPEMYFQSEFWNDRIVRAYATSAEPFVSPIMYSPKCEFDWDRSGAILATGCDKVPNAFYVRSDTVSVHLQQEVKRVHPPDWPSLTLMVGEPPPRLLSIVDGRNVQTGVLTGVMHVRTFLNRSGELRLRVGKAKDDRVVTVGTDKTSVPAGADATITVPIPAQEHSTSVTINTEAGAPSATAVTELDVHQPGSGWISIK